MIENILKNMMEKIDKFNKEIIELPIPVKPTLLNKDRTGWAILALSEELDEFERAAASNNLEEAADALIDLIYFAGGRLIEMGVPMQAIFDEVHKKNMEKKRGELSKRPGASGYDAVKPGNWMPPDHSWLLNFKTNDLRKLEAWDNLSPLIQDAVMLQKDKGSDYNDLSGGRASYFPFGDRSYVQMIYVKALRLVSLANDKTPIFEKTRDTIVDLINYAIYYGEFIDDRDN